MFSTIGMSFKFSKKIIIFAYGVFHAFYFFMLPVLIGCMW